MEKLPESVLRELSAIPVVEFHCPLCRRDIRWEWAAKRGPGSLISPICNSCEETYSRGIGKPHHGSYLDKRMVKRGFAIAEALRCAAAQREQGYSYGFA